MKRVKINVQGKVQGVCYRRFTLAKAKELGLTGYVSNCDDGSVSILVQGAFPAVDNLIDWCHDGPPHCRVSNVFIEEDDADEIYLDFSIVQS
ncbi:acylphosphatase [Shewanella eurypsychrophilus]|uniref:acylphosphatase n=1 Tax=Shewanella eurypsychrophilus TaxID=2593656 RepID=A0ABX6VF89_9GAMM|nr:MULTISPECIES: acylphosphatase [Shewanella]QFU25259.1 acylphosphatase [Shewanella sp. YLB-09]QPG60409.1 acylphosphatase [Shewanella eurypsychrophilus]